MSKNAERKRESVSKEYKSKRLAYIRKEFKKTDSPDLTHVERRSLKNSIRRKFNRIMAENGDKEAQHIVKKALKGDKIRRDAKLRIKTNLAFDLENTESEDFVDELGYEVSDEVASETSSEHSFDGASVMAAGNPAAYLYGYDPSGIYTPVSDDFENEFLAAPVVTFSSNNPSGLLEGGPKFAIPVLARSLKRARE